MTLKNKKYVLVTGGTGFVGRTLVPKLVQAGHRVTVLGRAPRSPFGKTAVYLRGDLANSQSLRKLGAVDAVIHLASNIDINGSMERPEAMIRGNVLMLLNLLEHFRNRREKPMIVFASTDRVYGKSRKRIVDERETPYPIEAYTASKIIGEILLETYSSLYGIPYIALRMDSVYGPRQPEQMFISNIIRKTVSLDEVPVGNLVAVRKNFVYVEDVADAFLKALRAPERARNTVYNIGGEHASLKKIFNIVRLVVERRRGRRIRTRFDPSLVRKSGTEVNPFRLSTQKAKRMFGWRAQTPLVKGLRLTVDWFFSTYDK